MIGSYILVAFIAFIVGAAIGGCYFDTFKIGAEWMRKKMIDKATQWITEHIDIPYEGGFIDDSPVASDYVEYLSKRLEYTKAIADAFKQAMEE